jgi:hypothetical protein
LAAPLRKMITEKILAAPLAKRLPEKIRRIKNWLPHKEKPIYFLLTQIYSAHSFWRRQFF